MTIVEKKIYNDILKMIKDNLKLLIINDNHYLKYFKEYCNSTKLKNLPISQEHLTILTEDALDALLRTEFLYDFRNIE